MPNVNCATLCKKAFLWHRKNPHRLGDLAVSRESARQAGGFQRLVCYSLGCKAAVVAAAVRYGLSVAYIFANSV